MLVLLLTQVEISQVFSLEFSLEVLILFSVDSDLFLLEYNELISEKKLVDLLNLRFFCHLHFFFPENYFSLTIRIGVIHSLHLVIFLNTEENFKPSPTITHQEKKNFFF